MGNVHLQHIAFIALYSAASGNSFQRINRIVFSALFILSLTYLALYLIALALLFLVVSLYS